LFYSYWNQLMNVLNGKSLQEVDLDGILAYPAEPAFPRIDKYHCPKLKNLTLNLFNVIAYPYKQNPQILRQLLVPTLETLELWMDRPYWKVLESGSIAHANALRSAGTNQQPSLPNLTELYATGLTFHLNDKESDDLFWLPSCKRLRHAEFRNCQFWQG